MIKPDDLYPITLGYDRAQKLFFAIMMSATLGE
jgi:hypothetical protein